jgi:hypothetical protein
MNHPYIASGNAKVRYDGLLQAAETHRRVKRLNRDSLGVQRRVLATLGAALIALGGKLEQRGRGKTRAPAWND